MKKMYRTFTYYLGNPNQQPWKMIYFISYVICYRRSRDYLTTVLSPIAMPTSKVSDSLCLAVQNTCRLLGSSNNNRKRYFF